MLAEEKDYFKSQKQFYEMGVEANQHFIGSNTVNLENMQNLLKKKKNTNDKQKDVLIEEALSLETIVNNRLLRYNLAVRDIEKEKVS